MNQRINPDLERAVSTAAGLSQEQQQALAAEILSRVGELSNSQMTDAQRAEVGRRLASPARYADPSKVQAFFARHGVKA